MQVTSTPTSATIILTNKELAALHTLLSRALNCAPPEIWQDWITLQDRLGEHLTKLPDSPKAPELPSPADPLDEIMARLSSLEAQVKQMT